MGSGAGRDNGPGAGRQQGREGRSHAAPPRYSGRSSNGIDVPDLPPPPPRCLNFRTWEHGKGYADMACNKGMVAGTSPLDQVDAGGNELESPLTACSGLDILPECRGAFPQMRQPGKRTTTCLSSSYTPRHWARCTRSAKTAWRPGCATTARVTWRTRTCRTSTSTTSTIPS